ncbi:6-phosphofructo-2-kinase-domain-containing protein [Blastocladiella britannica]|nr:6-phosphofructo-2-kinase-domain-containing protein [Blastocladiella britannica]
MTNNHKLACVMVGLPARGKTYISQKICRYLEWMGTSCKVFNVGQYRRKTAGANCRSEFFDPSNKEAALLRNEAASMALADMLKWFEEEDGCVAIYDATNTTKERRERIVKTCREHHVDVMFVESICQDPDVISHNIAEVKVSGPDYAGMDPETAMEDFKLRMRHYEKAYETVTEHDLSFVKLINVGSLVIINLIKGWLQSRIVYFLMNLHTQPRRILFSRHGESMYNVQGLLGGDADISSRGQLYAQSLPSVIAQALANNPSSPGLHETMDLAAHPQLTVWTSTLKRTQQTAAYLPYTKLAWKALDELDAGVCDGLTYEEIEQKFPEDYAERDADKYTYRYRGGESYHDVVIRLEPIIMELERQRNILIIGHQAILRCLYAYFMKIPPADLPYIKIPLHTVISITPRAYGCDEERYAVDIPAVDTHRDPRKRAANSSQGSKRGSGEGLAEGATVAAAAVTMTGTVTDALVSPPSTTLTKPTSTVAASPTGPPIELQTTTISAPPSETFPHSPATTRTHTPRMSATASEIASSIDHLSLTQPVAAQLAAAAASVAGRTAVASNSSAAASIRSASGSSVSLRAMHVQHLHLSGSAGSSRVASGATSPVRVNAPHLVDVTIADASEAAAEAGVKLTVVEPGSSALVSPPLVPSSLQDVDGQSGVIGGDLVE